MCIHELFTVCTQCASCVESQCVCMRGKHTWYQLGITVFSFAQMVFQLFHFSTVNNALNQFNTIADTCAKQGIATEKELAFVSDAQSQANNLVLQEKILTGMAITYFIFLFIFLVVFEFCKVEDRCASSDATKDKEFKCRQVFKLLLQIGFVVLVIKVLITTKQSDDLKSQLSSNICFNNVNGQKDIATIFNPQIYSQALINLVLLVLQVCLDYNCLLFPTVREQYFVWEHHEEEVHQQEAEREQKNRQRRRIAAPDINLPTRVQRKSVKFVHKDQHSIELSDGSQRESAPFSWPPTNK